MALGKSLTDRGRPAEALPVLEHAVALARFQGQPLVLVRTLQYLGEAHRVLDRREAAASATAEARSVLAACVDPASLADSSTSSARPARQSGTSPNGALTHRELTVLTLLDSDLSEADIGRELFVSHSTVHSHVRSIYLKLGVRSRGEAVATARDLGFLQTRSSSTAAAGAPAADAHGSAISPR
jgi:LuxR family maltose regulon positive regulatory protein